MRSLKEYTGKFYIKTTFQDVVALQYKLLCGQVNMLMFLFVSSSPWDIPCPVKLLPSLLYTRQKTKVFRLFGTSGCYHPLRLYVVFHTTFIIPPHTYTHLPPTSLSNTWSETLHSIKCLTTKLLVLITHCCTKLTSTCGCTEEFKLITITPTSCLSCLKTNVSFTLLFLPWFFPLKRHTTEGIFQGDLHLHERFFWAVNHKWHLPSHPHSTTKAQLVILVTNFKLLPKDFWTSLSTAVPLSSQAPLTPPRMPRCDHTHRECWNLYGFAISFSHMPLLWIFLLSRSQSNLFPVASPNCFMQPPFSLHNSSLSPQTLCVSRLCIKILPLFFC